MPDSEKRSLKNRLNGLQNKKESLKESLKERLERVKNNPPEIATNATGLRVSEITKELLTETIYNKCGLVADVTRALGYENDREAIYRLIRKFDLHEVLKEARLFVVDTCKSNVFKMACGEIRVIDPVLGNVYNIPPSESANRFFIQALDSDFTPKMRQEVNTKITLENAVSALSDSDLDKELESLE